MIDNLNNLKETNENFNSKELGVLGNAVESSCNSMVERLMPYYKEDSDLMHPQCFVEDLCLFYGEVINFEEMNEKVYQDLSNLLYLLDALFKYIECKNFKKQGYELTMHLLFSDSVNPFVRHWINYQLKNMYKSRTYMSTDILNDKFMDFCIREHDRLVKLLPYYKGVVEPKCEYCE